MTPSLTLPCISGTYDLRSHALRAPAPIDLTVDELRLAASSQGGPQRRLSNQVE